MDNNQLHGLLLRLQELVRKAATRISKLFDKIIYNQKASLICSGLFAMVFCISFSYTDLSYQLFGRDVTTLNLAAVPVEQLLDSDNYEVTGLPGTADVSIEGDATDIQLVRTQNSVTVRADLRSLAEGDNVVTLEAAGVPSGLTTTVQPATAQVVLAKKITRTFFISQSAVWMIGSGQSEQDFQIAGLSARSVSIKATERKLNSIRSVKVIIDTSGHASDFTTEASLVAYDAQGRPVNADISPRTITVSVEYLKKSVKPAEQSAEE